MRIPAGLFALLLAASTALASEKAGPPEGSAGTNEPSRSVVPAAPSTRPLTNVARDATRGLSLAEAVQERDQEAVRALLRSGAEVNSASGDGMTPLHWAAEAGDSEIGQMLLIAGAHVDVVTRIGRHTPLILAARSGAASLVQALLERGALPNQSSSTGTTALMVAAGAGSTEAVTALLDAGADWAATEQRHGQTALMFAAASNRADVIELLLDHGADTCTATKVVDATESEAKARAAFRKRLEAARAMEEELKKAAAAKAAAEKAEGGAAADAEPGASRSQAASNELQSQEAAPERKKKRRRKKAGKDAPRPLSFGQLVGRHGGNAALHYAARQGHLDSVRALLDGGADIDQQSEGDLTSPLLMATINGRFDTAMELLERGADPNLASAAGATPLYAAVNVEWAPHSFYPQPSPEQEQTSHLELMQALIDQGADVNARLTKKVWYTGFNFDQSGVDETGATAFWRAAQSSDVAAMKLLVAAGADPKLGSTVVPERRLPNGRNMDKDLEKQRPKIGDPAVDALVVASGGGWVGNFHRNAPGGMMPAVRYLVEELGFDVNATDHHGYTPLHHAAARGDNEMIVYLVLHGARPFAEAISGENVADMANGPVQRIQPFPETLALLEAMGVQHNDNCVSC